jgi:hypothetical protein
MATIEVTVLGQTKTITYPDGLEGNFLPLAAKAFGYPAYVPNPAAANDPTQPPMMANPKDALQYTMECVTGELVQRVRNVIAHEERQKAEAAIQAAINAQIGDVTVS